MNERNRKKEYACETDPWDQGSWQNGSTNPPKSRGGLVAVLLILVIFLLGITTLLSVLNIHLFRQLNELEEQQHSISFTAEEPQAAEATEATLPQTGGKDRNGNEKIVLDLQQTPYSIENSLAQEGLSLQEIYERNIPSVVSISASCNHGTSTGTGVIFSRDGYIVTNCHVVENATSITILLTDQREYPALLVGADEVSDLAVLYIQAEDLTPAQFGDSDSLRIGDSVAAIGDPLGLALRGSFTDGIVSAINRDVTVEGRVMTLIQTNAALNSGNSGGPLINCYGQVIGINTMKIGAFADEAGVEGLGFAIPSVIVKDVVDQLICQGYVSGRPSLGIAGEGLTRVYQYYYQLPAGLYITQVESGSDAESKGILKGDILVSIDGTDIDSMDRLNAKIYAHAVGDTVTVVIYRSGRHYEMVLTLGEATG